MSGEESLVDELNEMLVKCKTLELENAALTALLNDREKE